MSACGIVFDRVLTRLKDVIAATCMYGDTVISRQVADQRLRAELSDKLARLVVGQCMIGSRKTLDKFETDHLPSLLDFIGASKEQRDRYASLSCGLSGISNFKINLIRFIVSNTVCRGADHIDAILQILYACSTSGQKVPSLSPVLRDTGWQTLFGDAILQNATERRAIVAFIIEHKLPISIDDINSLRLICINYCNMLMSIFENISTTHRPRDDVGYGLLFMERVSEGISSMSKEEGHRFSFLKSIVESIKKESPSS